MQGSMIDTAGPYVICPVCGERMKVDILREAVHSRFPEQARRGYWGWCQRCQAGYQVELFRVPDGWRLHRYRLYGYIEATATATPKAVGQWRLVEPLPDAPVLMIGPGGDYDRPVDGDQIDEVVEKTLGTFNTMFHQAGQAMADLVELVRTRRRP